MPRRRRRSRRKPSLRIFLLAVAAIPALYLLAALVGAVVPVNRDWEEPKDGITIYLASNGVHADLILPASAQGLDWRPLVPRRDFADVPPDARWVAFGAGERRVYLETPTWGDISPRTIWAATTGGERVMHVEWVADPTYAARAIRLTPAQYRRLWAAIRAGFTLDDKGRPIRIDHPGYGPRDAFYQGVGKANAIDTCNQWVASRLRLAGVEAPSWAPFVQGLTWRYREAAPTDQRT
ncbi:TIGR02117 family protein [Sphingomonas sp. LY29]|uniref:TIGR02117 family protein n=1 Tax=Sphingomonas sp. LY29 TaxID=3095341 RepID=UPI002D76B67B|nr:TIGR02117 family protein [Sphingomonas sp. LY29]WRP25209.1 TIGR02117 family protein [Sphingomonas sp. LY29]